MPSVSEKQRKMMAIAEHDPSKLYKRNRGALSMSKEQLSEFASGKLSKSQKKSTKGSPELTDSEMKQGYRKL